MLTTIFIAFEVFVEFYWINRDAGKTHWWVAMDEKVVDRTAHDLKEQRELGVQHLLASCLNGHHRPQP